MYIVGHGHGHGHVHDWVEKKLGRLVGGYICPWIWNWIELWIGLDEGEEVVGTSLRWELTFTFCSINQPNRI